MHHVLEIRGNRVISLESYDEWDSAFRRAVELCHKFGSKESEADIAAKLAANMIYDISVLQGKIVSIQITYQFGIIEREGSDYVRDLSLPMTPADERCNNG